MAADLKRLNITHGDRTLTFDSSEGPDGPRALVLWTTAEEGTLPLINLTRDEAFQALEWISRWLQQPRQE